MGWEESPLPDINKQTTPTTRHPRGAVFVNDVLVPWESWEVSNNSTFDADEFRVTLPISSLPKDLPAAAMIDGRALRIEIRGGLVGDPGNYSVKDLTQLILGRVDDVAASFERGVVELCGRDFTGLLIDRKTAEKFANMTASDVASLLAARVGLTPVVTTTKMLSGAYYAIDHALMSREVSEWDLLCWLAMQEGFAVYVKGTELHFEPKPSGKRDPYALVWTPPSAQRGVQFTGQTLSLSRNLTVTRDVTVTVKSFNAKGKQVVIATYPRSKRKGAAAGASGANQPDGYVRTIPGLTYEQALQRAQSIHQQITAHEMKLAADMPADTVLDITMPIELRGTGTAFDQTYYPESITRRMSLAEGFAMTVRAKNRAPENEVTL